MKGADKTGLDAPGVADGKGGDTEVKRLRWRCRRGMRELDQLLTRYLDHAWLNASAAERGVFLRLLDCEDDKLWRWFLGHEAPADAEIEALLHRIAGLPP